MPATVGVRFTLGVPPYTPPAPTPASHRVDDEVQPEHEDVGAAGANVFVLPAKRRPRAVQERYVKRVVKLAGASSCPSRDVLHFLDLAQTAQWLYHETVKCPSCKVRIWRDGGCEHMQCSRCNTNFDWNVVQRAQPYAGRMYNTSKDISHNVIISIIKELSDGRCQIPMNDIAKLMHIVRELEPLCSQPLTGNYLNHFGSLQGIQAIKRYMKSHIQHTMLQGCPRCTHCGHAYLNQSERKHLCCRNCHHRFCFECGRQTTAQGPFRWRCPEHGLVPPPVVLPEHKPSSLLNMKLLMRMAEAGVDSDPSTTRTQAPAPASHAQSGWEWVDDDGIEGEGSAAVGDAIEVADSDADGSRAAESDWSEVEDCGCWSVGEVNDLDVDGFQGARMVHDAVRPDFDASDPGEWPDLAGGTTTSAAGPAKHTVSASDTRPIGCWGRPDTAERLRPTMGACDSAASARVQLQTAAVQEMQRVDESSTGNDVPRRATSMAAGGCDGAAPDGEAKDIDSGWEKVVEGALEPDAGSEMSWASAGGGDADSERTSVADDSWDCLSQVGDSEQR